jgi:hypothetical protein
VKGERHECPGVDPRPAEELVRRVRAESWLMTALEVVAASGLPDAWIGAGAIRDVIWGQLSGGFTPATVRDVDVAFFDAADVNEQRDARAQRRLDDLADLPWEATNQAAVHTWYHRYFGGPPVAAFGCVHDAVATWPETATSVALRRGVEGIEICAPLGLADLLDGVWRRNPTRVTIQASQARLDRHRVTERWPGITVIPPERVSVR